MHQGSHYLVGAIGNPNYGDDFIARSWLRFLAETHPDVDVWVDCLDPGVAALLLAHEHPRVRFTNTLWETTRQSESIVYPALRERMQHLVHRLGTPRVDIGLEGLRHARSIHLMGGGYLNAIWPRNLGLIAAVAELGRAFGVTTFATGLGLLPTDAEGLDQVRDDLAGFTVAEVRDAASAQAFNLPLGLDDAFLGFHGLGRELADDDDQPAVPRAVVLIQGDFVDEEAWRQLEPVVHDFAARYAGAEGEQLVFLEALPPLDAHHWDDLRSRYPRADLIPFQRLWERGIPAGPDQHWLTTRFHGHLIAAAHGARGIAVSASPEYYGTKHRSLIDVGTGWRYLALDELRPGIETARDEAFLASVPELYARKRDLALRLYPEVAATPRPLTARARSRLARILAPSG